MYFFFGRFAGMGCTFFSGVLRGWWVLFLRYFFIFAVFRIRKRRGRSWGNIIPMKIEISDSLE